MHRRLPFLLGFALVAILVLAIGSGVGFASSPSAAPEALEAQMSAAQDGKTITYTITIINGTDKGFGDIFIAGTIVSGASFDKIVSTPANAVPIGKTGDSVAWISTGVPAKSQQGPFKFKVNVTGQIEPAHAWIHWSVPKDGVALSPDKLESPVPLAKVRGVNLEDHELLPDKEVAITLSGGYGYHENNVIVSTGLSSVGVGEFIFFEGADVDAFGNTITSWKWSSTGPAGSVAKLERADTRTPRLRTDKVGAYDVTLVADNTTKMLAETTITVRAGKYAGVQTCALCHSGAFDGLEDIYSKWMETGHATKFETAFASYSPTSDYCVRCHTVGYDESAKAGGFSDEAKAIGWDPAKEGSFLKWAKGTKKFTLADLQAEPGVASMMGIQCESCHGPGGSGHTKAKSFDPSVCAVCHTAQPKWLENAKHVEQPPVHMAESSDCAQCHTGQGFVEIKIRGVKGVTPHEATAAKPANLPDTFEMAGITCVTCHDPHQATNPFPGADGNPKSLQLRLQGAVTTPQGVTVDAEESAVCVSCHANKRDVAYKADYLKGNKTRGAHDNTQTDVLKGFGAFEFGKPFGSSYHATGVKEACVACHMAAPTLDNPGADGKAGTRDDVKVTTVGSHSFAVTGTWDFNAHTPSAAGKVVENVNGCNVKGCHSDLTTFNRTARGDYDGDGKVEGVKDEVDGLLKILAALLPKTAAGAVMSSGITATNTNEIQRKALWNYTLINNDGSRGVHNTRFAVEVLQASIEALSGKPIPGAAKP